MYILLVYERELSKNDYPKTTNNNYKKHQKVNKKNKKNYLKIIIQTDKKLLLKFWLAHFPM